MVTSYFRNRSVGGYDAALANLLLEQGDPGQAIQVYNRFLEHRLVRPDVVLHPGLTTRLILELTRGEYFGTLYAHWSQESIESTARVEFGTSADEILRIMDQEMNQGRIVFETQSLQFDPPVLGLVLKDYGLLNWITYFGPNRHIDDGFVCESEPAEIYGLLEVREIG